MAQQLCSFGTYTSIQNAVWSQTYINVCIFKLSLVFKDNIIILWWSYADDKYIKKCCLALKRCWMNPLGSPGAKKAQMTSSSFHSVPSVSTLSPSSTHYVNSHSRLHMATYYTLQFACSPGSNLHPYRSLPKVDVCVDFYGSLITHIYLGMSRI